MKKTLVFGASLKSYRYSYLAIKKLAEHGIETVGFGAEEGRLFDTKISSSLEEFKTIHTISMYMSPESQAPFHEYLLGLQPERVIFNPGSENSVLKAKMEAAGIRTVEGCTLVMLSTGRY